MADRGEPAAPASPAAADLVADDMVEAAPAANESRMEVEPVTTVQPVEASAAEPAEPTPAITGRVVDPDGRPIAGATVWASGNQGFDLDFESGADVPAWMKRSVAVTDADGGFALDGVKPPTLRLTVQRSGFVEVSEDRIALPDVEAFEVPEIVLQPAAVLEGFVVDPFGQGVAGAELFIEETDGFRFRGVFGSWMDERPDAVTDDSGAFRLDTLPLGAWSVRVHSEDHPERTFEGLAERAGAVVTRTFELLRGDSIAGRVTDLPDGEAPETLVVRARLAERGDFFGFGSSGRRADVAPDGTFELKGLRADTNYYLQVQTKPNLERWGGFDSRNRSESLEFRAGQRNVELPFSPEAAVLFTVVDDETGLPIEDFAVEQGFRWRTPLLGPDSGPLRTHPQGRVRIGNLRPEDGVDDLQLSITALGYRGFEREDVRVPAGEEVELGEIRLEPLPMVHVTVVDKATGEPIEGAQVSLEEQEEESNGFGRGVRSRSFSISIDASSGEPVATGAPGVSAQTDEDGLAHLNSLEGKTCKLTVKRDGYATETVSGLLLPTGEAFDQVVRLGAGGTVVVRVVDEAGDPISGVRVDHRAPEAEGGGMPALFGARRSDAVTDADGEFAFKNLAEGQHRFQIRRQGGGGASFGGGMLMLVDGGESADDGWTRVDVVEGAEETVVLVRAARGSLKGRITEVGVELVGATVKLSARQENDEVGFGFLAGGGRSERTDSAGRYALDDLEPGPYTLTVSHPTRRMPMQFELEIEAGENRYDADLPVSVVEGRVTDLDGRGLPGARVTARKAAGGGGRSGRMMFMVGGPVGEDSGTVSFGDELGEETTTDADGYYSLRGVVPDVELVVRASGEGLQTSESEPVTVSPNDIVKGVDVGLEAAGSVQVEVLAADGGSPGFAMVRASYLDEVPDGAATEGADNKNEFVQNGETRLTGLRPGRWRVSVTPVGNPSQAGADAPEPQEVEVEVDVEPTLTFVMP